MATVFDLKERQNLCSITRGAAICGVSRETVRKRISDAGLLPANEDENGNPLYRIADLVCCVAGAGRTKQQANVIDPAALPASERNAWYQSESRRLDLAERARQLVPVADVRAEIGASYAEFARFLETLPDVLERDASLNLEQVEAMHEALRNERQRLYEEMVAARVAASSVNA
jgi:hypothetical protein